MPRYRGRVEPANLAHLIQLSHEKYGERLKSLPKDALPAAYDSRTLGYVGPIKNQMSCGDCWNLSGTGVCEIAFNKSGIGGGANRFILSEEYTNDCGSNGGCSGDDNTTVLAWAKATGLPLTSAYGPYTSGSGYVGSCQYQSGMTLYRITDWGFSDSNGGQGVTSVEDIKASIIKFGGVGAGIAADSAFEAWGDQSPSMSNPFQGSGATAIDHDIILVGWQKDGSWILRNSWDVTWGVQGYMAIMFGANNVGNESVWAYVKPLIPPKPPTPVPIPPDWGYSNFF